MKIGNTWRGYKTVVIRRIEGNFIYYSNVGLDTVYKCNLHHFKETFPTKVEDV